VNKWAVVLTTYLRTFAVFKINPSFRISKSRTYNRRSLSKWSPNVSRKSNDVTLYKQKKKAKTYNRRDSQMVTHSSTSRPVQCLCMAERTGCPVLTDLWSYVPEVFYCGFYYLRKHVLLDAT
jgi:hypothetical protein